MVSAGAREGLDVPFRLIGEGYAMASVLGLLEEREVAARKKAGYYRDHRVRSIPKCSAFRFCFGSTRAKVSCTACHRH
jgi:hypothetical protein